MAAKFMQQALELAKESANKNEIPVGAILVKNGEIISSAHNLTETNNDPCAHAEILAIRQACDKLNSPRLPDCDLYVTLEPCNMCATAISFARIRRLYFGAYDNKGGAVENSTRFYSNNSCNHTPEVIGGIMESDCAKILKEFFKQRR